MRAIVFDTLNYANKLQAVGFTKAQAEVQAETLAELIDDNLATKRDLLELESRLESKILIKVGAMIAASIAITTTLVKAL